MKLKQFIEALIQDAAKMWKTAKSDEATREKINTALRSSSVASKDSYVHALFPDVAIVRDYEKNKWLAVEYGVDGDNVTFGDSQEVEQAFIPKAEQEAAENKNSSLLNETLAKPHRIQEIRECTLEILEMKDGKPKRLKGQFIESDTFNDSDPRRIYPDPVISDATNKFNVKPNKYGLDGHKTDGSYGDIVLLHDKLYMQEGFGYFEAEIITETEAGRVIQAIAERKIPITVSLSSLGSEKFDKEIKDKKGRVGGYVVQEGLEILTLDPVLHQAFSNAKAMLEQKVIRDQKEKQANEGGKDMDELKKLIEALTLQVKTLEEKIKTPATALDEETKKLIEELRTERDRVKAQLDAKKKVKEILEAEELKDFEHKDILQKHLEECATVEEVDKAYPRTLKTLKALIGESVKPVPVSVVIPEGSIFGGDMPDSPYNAMQRMLDKFEDNKQLKHNNPRWIAERLIKNYVKLQLTGADIDSYEGNDPDSIVFQESRRNPLFVVTKKAKRMREALGDTEAYTSDIKSTGAHILPLYIWVVQDMINLMNGVAAIQTLDRPSGEAFFMKEYYGNMAGAYTEINAANFNRTAGNIAEGGVPKQVKIGIDKDTISLATSKKFQFPFTIELEQDLAAYWNLGLDSIAVQTMRREAFREIAADFFNALLNTAALSKGDGLIENAGSPINFSLTPDEGWTGGDWIGKGFTKALKQASSLLDKDPWNLEPDWIIAYSQLKYLFTEPVLVADKVKTPGGLGFTRQGVYSEEWNLFTSGNSMFNNQVVLGYRGSMFTDAAMIFLPFILFWIGPRINLQNAKAVRETMSRFAIVKACGAKIIRMVIQP